MDLHAALQLWQALVCTEPPWESFPRLYTFEHSSGLALRMSTRVRGLLLSNRTVCRVVEGLLRYCDEKGYYKAVIFQVWVDGIFYSVGFLAYRSGLVGSGRLAVREVGRVG